MSTGIATQPFQPFSVIPDRNRPRRMVFYGRVSTEHEAQLSALENQIQWYDDQLKYHPNWTLVDRYIDEGITGTQAKKRPSFLRMIEDAKKDKFDLIVTREVCRFARNTVDTLIYTRQLKNDFGIEVYFVEDNIWTMDGDGELRLTIMATLAQEESRKTSERVKAGQFISRQNGVLYGNGNILGYDRDGDTYVINPEQAETVRMIYDMYLGGMGTMKIAKELAIQQRKDASGNVKWTASKVGRILKRSTYKGVMAYNQSHVNNYLDQKRVNNYNRDTYEYVESNYPPIVSAEEWDQVQKIMSSKRVQPDSDTDKSHGKKPANDIWLKKLKCKCGCNFRKNKWRVNKTGDICFGYQCYNQVNNGSKSFREKHGLDTEGYCDIKMIADWKLDFMAKEVIGSLWKERSESFIEAYQMLIECYEEEPLVQINNKKHIEDEISKLRIKIENLIEMRAEGELDREEYFSMKKKFESKIEELSVQLDVYEEEHFSKKDIDDKLKELKEILATTIDFSQAKLSDYIIDRFITRVVPIDNNLFRWYIKLTDSNPEQEVCIGVEGRKNNPNLLNEKGEIHLPSYQCCSGCYITKVGEFFAYIFVIPYNVARHYRKSFGSYLRPNQWEDITIEVYVSI